MSTITVELTIKVKTKFTSSNAEKIKWIHLTTDVTQFSHSGATQSPLRCALSIISLDWVLVLLQDIFVSEFRQIGIVLQKTC